MAKKRKRKSKKQQESKWNLAEGIPAEIYGVLMIVLGLVIIVGLFTTGNGADKVAVFFQLLFGYVAFFVPVALTYSAVKIFKNEDHALSLGVIAGLLLSIFMLSGLFHLPIDELDSARVATAGSNGGFVGHLMVQLIAGIFGKIAASFIFLGFLVVGLMLSLNLRINDIIAWWNYRQEEKDTKSSAEKIAEKLSRLDEPKSTPKLNTNVPLVSKPTGKRNMPESSGDTKEPAGALVTGSDPDWNFPDPNLLENKVEKADAGDWKGNAEVIRQTLEDFKIEVTMDDINVGPRVTQYTLSPPSGVRLSKITALEQNIALNLAAESIRIEAPIPGKRAVGIEVPNKKSATVRMRSIIDSHSWKESRSPLAFALGQDISGEPQIGELDAMPHMLIAGATGAGKSVMINTFLLSLLYRNSPADLKLILVDPKQVELNLYEGMPHLLTPVITEPEKCISALKWAVAEMERRYGVLAENGKRNIADYNKIKKEEGMPYIVIVIDELADLMMIAARDVETLIVRIAQKARATGIHLVLATQRPSVDVITGLIKANIPARIAFTVASQVDSRTILDSAGAEKLLGKGDMLFQTPSLSKPRRIQGVFVSDDEVNAVVNHIKLERAPEYNDDITSQQVTLGGKGTMIAQGSDADDPMFEDAVKVIIESGKGSASLIQRRLRVGYSRAARLIETMEDQGIVGPQDGSRPRDVLVASMEDYYGASEQEDQS